MMENQMQESEMQTNIVAETQTENNAEDQTITTEEQTIPVLRYKDQTPFTPVRKGEKRQKIDLSPLDSIIEGGDFSRTISDTIEEKMKAIIPQIVQKIKESLKTTFEEMLNKAIGEAKLEVKNEVKRQMAWQSREMTLKALSESEVIETYIRRENVRIMGIPENATNDNRQNWESSDATTVKVIDIANKVGSNLEKSNISIAHRLPTRSQGPRPIIARFANRSSRIDLLRNKKKFKDIDELKNVRVFEDLTLARVKFFNMMKTDTRIENVWTREGTINYKLAGDSRVQTIKRLFQIEVSIS